MNAVHDTNRRYWDRAAGGWEKLSEEDGFWRRCVEEPDLAFAGGALELIREFGGDLSGKDVCVLGSGDNLAALALAGMGANVVSTDISERRLEIASNRAARLALPITFVQADAGDLAPLGDAEFDLVCSTNGFFVWISDLSAVFGEASRILRPGGHYVFYDIHPFQRPWRDQARPIAVEKSYWETGPLEDQEERTFEFHWTLADILNPLAASGLILRRILESPAKDSRYWQDHAYMPGTDDSLLDWDGNPRAALPVWLAAAAQRPS